MDLKNKVLVGGSLCGALALDAEYTVQTDEFLKNQDVGRMTIEQIAGKLGKMLAVKNQGAFDMSANEAGKKAQFYANAAVLKNRGR